MARVDTVRIPSTPRPSYITMGMHPVQYSCRTKQMRQTGASQKGNDWNWNVSSVNTISSNKKKLECVWSVCLGTTKAH